MQEGMNRRAWLRNSGLAALGLSLNLKSLGNEERLLRSFGKAEGLINLGSNENPYGIAPGAKQAIADMAGLSNRYQFNIPSMQGFRKTLANYYGLESDQVLVTAGSSEGLNLAARHFSGGPVVSASPTFFILPELSRKLGNDVIEVPVTPAGVHDLEAMADKVTSTTKLVYICNPANPTATILDAAKLHDFTTSIPKQTVVLIDEAYMDFQEDPNAMSMMDLVHDHPNVLILRTFSKIHGMAGIRVGFAAGHASLIKSLEDNFFDSTQMCVSNLTMAAAAASMEDEAYRNKVRDWNKEARSYAMHAIQQMGRPTLDSATNFFMFNLGKYPGDFASDMLAKGYIIRSNNFGGGKWCRVSIGTMDEMKSFVGAVQDMVGQF